jgi:carboxymethylenebutenolidase
MERKQASDFDQELLNLFDKYVHGDIDRRGFLERAGKYAVGGVTAMMLLDQLNPRFAEAEVIPKDDKRLTTSTVEIDSPQGTGKVKAYFARPASARGKLPGVLVIHENRGLTDHIRSVAGRFAASGWSALALDLLSEEGGTASFPDEAAVSAALAQIAPERFDADMKAAVTEIEKRLPRKRIAAIGFCFGGGMVWRLLNGAPTELAAAVPFYGPAPAEPTFANTRAAVLGVFAELDNRVNAGRDALDAALTARGLTHEMVTVPGVDHAFFNDTGPRFNAAAAAATYQRVLDWFNRYLTT